MEIYKNHLKIGDSVIQFEWGHTLEEYPYEVKEGYYLITPEYTLGPYNHVYDAIEEILKAQNN